MRRLEVTGNASTSDNNSRVTLDVSGVSAAACASHQTSVATKLGQKQNTLSSGGGTAVHILDTANNIIRRISLYGNVNTTSDQNEVVVHIRGRTDSEVDTLLNAKQATSSNNSGSTSEALLSGNALRKIRASTGVSLALVDGYLSISSIGGVTASDVATSIAAAVSAYTLTSTLTTQLAAKQGILSVSANGAGSPWIDIASKVIRKISVTGNLSLSTVSKSMGLQIHGDSYTQRESM